MNTFYSFNFHCDSLWFHNGTFLVPTSEISLERFEEIKEALDKFDFNVTKLEDFKKLFITKYEIPKGSIIIETIDIKCDC